MIKPGSQENPRYSLIVSWLKHPATHPMASSGISQHSHVDFRRVYLFYLHYTTVISHWITCLLVTLPFLLVKSPFQLPPCPSCLSFLVPGGMKAFSPQIWPSSWMTSPMRRSLPWLEPRGSSRLAARLGLGAKIFRKPSGNLDSLDSFKSSSEPLEMIENCDVNGSTPGNLDVQLEKMRTS